MDQNREDMGLHISQSSHTEAPSNGEGYETAVGHAVNVSPHLLLACLVVSAFYLPIVFFLYYSFLLPIIFLLTIIFLFPFYFHPTPQSTVMPLTSSRPPMVPNSPAL